MKKSLLGVICMLGLGVAAPAFAQDLSVKSSTNFYVFQAQNTSTASEDRVAVRGISTPAANWGVGAQFDGGFVGLRSNATVSGAGNRYGAQFTASGGTTSNIGLWSTASGGSSAWAGFFTGNVYVSGTLTQASDAKLKLDVQDLDAGTLGLVLKLKPKRYRYNQAVLPRLSLPAGVQLGFVAQEVAQVFPDLVRETIVPADEKGKADEKVLGVDYIKLVPLLVKALQEQQAQIDALKAQVATLSGR